MRACLQRLNQQYGSVHFKPSTGQSVASLVYQTCQLTVPCRNHFPFCNKDERVMRGLSPKDERDGDMGPLIKGGIGADFAQPQEPRRRERQLKSRVTWLTSVHYTHYTLLSGGC